MENTKPKNTKLIAIIASVVIVVIVAIIAIVLVVKNSGSKGLVGKWAQTGGTEYVYSFAENGTGSFGLCPSGTSEKECDNDAAHFHYQLKKDGADKSNNIDGSIEMLYEGSTASFTLTYHLDGDSLTIYDSFGGKGEYKRSK